MSDAPFDEEFDTMMEVEKNPTGAFMAIQQQVRRIEELEAVIVEAFENMRDSADASAFAILTNACADIESRAALSKGTEGE